MMARRVIVDTGFVFPFVLVAMLAMASIVGCLRDSGPVANKRPKPPPPTCNDCKQALTREALAQDDCQ